MALKLWNYIYKIIFDGKFLIRFMLWERYIPKIDSEFMFNWCSKDLILSYFNWCLLQGLLENFKSVGDLGTI